MDNSLDGIIGRQPEKPLGAVSNGNIPTTAAAKVAIVVVVERQIGRGTQLLDDGRRENRCGMAGRTATGLPLVVGDGKVVIRIGDPMGECRRPQIDIDDLAAILDDSIKR